MLLTRIQGYYQRTASRLFFKRPLVVTTSRPVISFSFDDFPQSALYTGGAILNHFGVAGTYYAAFGLMGKDEPSGHIFVPDDLKLLQAQGHELGCHTFSHRHSWDTPPHVFEEAILQNRAALHKLLPAAEFRTFSYPISGPRPFTKARTAKHFLCSRGGGQTFNVGTADRNHLAAFFLEKSRDRMHEVKDVIDRNRQANGWLIFATHDISDHPTPYGCSPSFFEDVVRYSVASGACILPVDQALSVVSGLASTSQNTVAAMG